VVEVSVLIANLQCVGTTQITDFGLGRLLHASSR